MTAGLLVKGRIWRISHSDDDVGGAIPSGTIIYYPVFARISEQRATQALLEQGLETPTIYNVVFQGPNMRLESNDIYEDFYYPASPYYGLKFVIIGVHLPSLIDGRKYLSASMRRFDVAHSNDWQ